MLSTNKLYFSHLERKTLQIQSTCNYISIKIYLMLKKLAVLYIPCEFIMLKIKTKRQHYILNSFIYLIGLLNKT